MDWVWWSLSIILMVAGFIGTVLPLLPGPVLILCGAVLHHLTMGAEKSAGWGTLIGLLVLTILAQALDILSGSIGAKYFGATRWGAIGGILGSIIGLFFGIPGLILGPILGVLAGELLGGKGILPAGQSAWGTVLGTTAGMAGKLVIGAIMITWFWIAVWLR